MVNLLDKILDIFEVIPNKRSGDILIRRFGLGRKKETLESIGQRYGVTRERIRQIEKNIFKKIEESGFEKKIEPEISLVKSYLREWGGIKREDVLIDDLAKKSLLEQKITEGILPKRVDGLECRDINEAKGFLFLFLTLGKKFFKYSGDHELHPVWAISQKNIDSAKKFLNELTDVLKQRGEVISEDDLINLIQKEKKNLSKKEIISYLESSKLIRKNSLGNYGLKHWIDISPKGMADRAYLILKHIGHPLHFLEITRQIDQSFTDSKKPYAPTVHNALIRDQRFILVGRGLYGLKVWDFYPGSTLDIIKEIIRQDGPKSKEEILSVVSKKKLVKKTTILAYLQNKKYFRRNEEGKYDTASQSQNTQN